MMTESKNVFESARDLVDRFDNAARKLLEETSFAVVVSSSELSEVKRAASPEFNWLSKLPEDLRKAAREVQGTRERLERVLKEAAKDIEPDEKRALVEDLLEEILGCLRVAVQPAFYQDGTRPGPGLGELDDRQKKLSSDIASEDRGARLNLLDSEVKKLHVVIEEIEAAAPDLPSPPPEVPAPHVEADKLDEIEGLIKRGEGPYIRLVEELPLKKVKGMKLRRHPLLPAHTPPWCFDWDAAKRTPDQVSALGEVRSHYGRLKRLLEQALGVLLGIPRPRDLEEAPPELERASMVVRQCDEALFWLGTTLPLGDRLPHAHGGYASADHLRAFMLTKVEFCFSELRDAVDQLRSRLAEAEGQGEAEEREAAAPSEAGNCVFARQDDFWRLVFDGREAIVKHLLGNVYIAEALRNPQKPVSAAALCALGTKREDPPRSGPAHKVSDKEALADYASRGRDLMRELDEAKRSGDMAAQERIAQELANLGERMSKDAALGGRTREFPDEDERARSSVAHAIGKSLRAIKKVHMPLWQHLKAYLHTGTDVRYTPDGHIVWQT